MNLHHQYYTIQLTDSSPMGLHPYKCCKDGIRQALWIWHGYVIVFEVLFIFGFVFIFGVVFTFEVIFFFRVIFMMGINSNFEIVFIFEIIFIFKIFSVLRLPSFWVDFHFCCHLLKWTNFILQRSTVPKNLVEFCKKSIGPVRWCLTTL